MPNLRVAFVGLATLAPIFVTKQRRPQRAALAMLALLTACASPTPPAPNPAPVTLTTPPPTSAATPASAISTPGGAPSSVAQPGVATPGAPGALDALSAEQRAAFAEARLSLVEGDFKSATDKF